MPAKSGNRFSGAVVADSLLHLLLCDYACLEDLPLEYLVGLRPLDFPYQGDLVSVVDTEKKGRRAFYS